MIIDATDTLLGRLASYAAKKALLGEKVYIINCEKAVISGKKQEILQRYSNKMSRGIPSKGPFFSRLPHLFVKRVIRGMLPYKQEKGKSAFKRIMCYQDVPEPLKGQKAELIKSAQSSKLPDYKFISVAQLCRILGGK